MPCWEVRTVNVEFKAAHADLLDKAIKALGWKSQKLDANNLWVFSGWGAMTLNLATGKSTIREDQQAKLNELKRAYSAQAIKLAAKLNGWQVKTAGANKGLLTKGVL